MSKKDFILLTVLFLIFIAIVLISLFLVINIEKIYYWYLLISWVILIWKLKLGSGFSLGFALLLFIISVLIALLNFADIAEIIMRISFTGFLIGIFQAFIECLRNEKSASP